MTTTKPASEWTAEELLGNRQWASHLSVEQMRKQIAHEQAGFPLPFPGAVWNGYVFVSGKAERC